MLPGQVPFQAHIELLTFFLAQRHDLVEHIEGLLNAQRRPVEYLRDASLLSRLFEDGFFTHPGITQPQLRLRGQLDEAHWASGFKPRDLPGLHNGLIDPAEMMIRGFHLWQQTRWPGRNGRIRYAHTLFNLYVIRCLELLSMRLWDDGPASAAERLAHVQEVLDGLWRGAPADQPVLVRDARWLIQLAQSPATDDLGAYFIVTERIAESLPRENRLAIHKAGVRMAAGHLRSQTRHYATKNALPLGDQSLVLSTRNTNALDFALLLQELVPLLEAYEHAVQAEDAHARLELADAICQGVSPDPELFLNRVELLGAYSMIEHLFITTDGDGHAAYTPMGERHVRLVQDYEARIGRLSKPLLDDCLHFRPVAGGYSPYGVLYGFSSDLLEHMAFKTLQAGTATPFSLEDIFTGGDASKLAWVSGWRKLPHLPPEVTRLFDYPQQFAEDMFARVEQALRTRAADGETNAAARTGRLFTGPDDELPDLPARYVGAYPSSERREGKCLVSYETADGWVAITKTVLTDVLGTGHDVKIAGLPSVAVEALQLMCPGLVVSTSTRRPASPPAESA